jgi:hypothetical protein
MTREEVNKADFDYLMMHTDKNPQSSVSEHAVHVPVAEVSAESADKAVVHLNEREDSSISADSVLESPAVEDASVSEVQMSEPRELTPKANGNVELAFSETQSGETRTKSQSHARTLKTDVSHPKTDEHQSAEDASDH